MAPSIALHEATANWALGSSGDLVVFSARTPVPVPVVQRIRERMHAVGAAHPAGVGYLHVIESGPSNELPSEATRRAFVELVRDAGPAARAGLIVIARSGFAGAAVRAVVSGILLAGRTRMPVKVTGSVGAGAEWFLRTLREGGATGVWTARDLEDLAVSMTHAIEAAAESATA